MSKSKRISIIAASSIVLGAFTAWNVIDFCKAADHSTTAYLAIGFNALAIAELIRIIALEVKRREQ